MSRIIKRVLFVLVIMIGITVLAGCGKVKNKLVGSWDHEGYVYTFKSDKTGNYSLYGGKMDFTYEDDGEKVSITFEGNTSSMVLPYKIEGKKLIITDSFNNEVIYTRK